MECTRTRHSGISSCVLGSVESKIRHQILFVAQKVGRTALFPIACQTSSHLDMQFQHSSCNRIIQFQFGLSVPLMSAEIIARAKEYIAWDPNSETKALMEGMMNDASKEGELKKLLTTRLEFGTAGLRGPMGVGYCRMNDLVVLQTAQGLAKYLEGFLGVDVAHQRV